MKKHYDMWNIPWSEDIDEINLVIKDDFYINEIDNESIFYKDIEYETVNIGQIILEIGNLLYIGKEKFFALFKKYKVSYDVPTLEFVKEYFFDLIDLGFCQLLAHSLVDYIILSFEKDDTFKNAYIENSTNIEEWMDYPVNKMIVFLFGQLNPIHIMSKEYKPFNSIFKTHITEIDNELLSVCTEVDLWSLINLDALYSRKNKIKVLQCKYCRTFFIKTHGNNTAQCKKCADIEYSQKKDVFYQLYRKSQKTMLQRSYRHPIIESWQYQEHYTTPWEKDITSVIDTFRENNDYSGFENYIRKSMDKYKPKRKD